MMKNKKNAFILLGIIFGLAIIICIILFAGKDGEENSENVTKPISNLGDVTGTVKKNETFIEPEEDSIDINKIQGFSPNISDDKQVNKKSDEETKRVNAKDDTKRDYAKEENRVYKLSDERLQVASVGAYTGNFIEDGSDEAVKGITAMVVTNNSEKMLQVGDITFQVNKKEQAKFRITNLMPHTSVLVLELNRRKYREKDNYSFGNVATAYLDKPTIPEDKFEIIKDNGKLTIVNKTEEKYDTVYVYYKYARSGGVYMGGITYRVPFENVGAKKSVESIANHFNKDSSRIIDMQILNEQ